MDALRALAEWLLSALVLVLFICLSPILVPVIYWFAITHGSTSAEKAQR